MPGLQYINTFHFNNGVFFINDFPLNAKLFIIQNLLTSSRHFCIHVLLTETTKLVSDVIRKNILNSSITSTALCPNNKNVHFL